MRFEGTAEYVATEDLMVAVNAAIRLERPLLVKGEPGTGKTELARQIAAALGLRLIEWHVKSTTRAQQGLYEYDAVSRLRDSQLGDGRVRDVGNYIKPGKLWDAFTADERVVLLIDEVDKGDPEFEAFLLEVLSDFQVTVPELGTIKATQIPMVFLTSNNTREMSDALKRRCLHLFIDYPSEDLELRILKAKVPEAADHLIQDLVAMMQKLRDLDLKKTPSISETLDWARALLALNATELESNVVNQTLNVILKYEGDVRKAQGELDKLLAKKAGEAAVAAPASATPSPKAAKKGALH